MRFPDLSLSIVKADGRGRVRGRGSRRQEPTGHFGLAVKDYTHSTAPNRRYPDLITHRMVKAALAGKPAAVYVRRARRARAALHRSGRRGEQGRAAGAQVRRGDAAQRPHRRDFEGVVTGASAKGTWVRVFQPPVEGKVVRGSKARHRRPGEGEARPWTSSAGLSIFPEARHEASEASGGREVHYLYYLHSLHVVYQGICTSRASSQRPRPSRRRQLATPRSRISPICFARSRLRRSSPSSRCCRANRGKGESAWLRHHLDGDTSRRRRRVIAHRQRRRHSLCFPGDRESGAGSSKARAQALLSALFARATAAEQRFL